MALKAKLSTPLIDLEVEGETARAVIEQLAFFAALPQVCPANGCGARLSFFHRRPQDFDYYGLRCDGVPSHECNFGIHMKAPNDIFYAPDRWQLAYGQEEEQEEEREAQPEGNSMAVLKQCAALFVELGGNKDKGALLEALNNLCGTQARDLSELSLKQLLIGRQKMQSQLDAMGA